MRTTENLPKVLDVLPLLHYILVLTFFSFPLEGGRRRGEDAVASEPGNKTKPYY